MRVRGLLLEGNERLMGSWKDEQMRDSENSTYVAELGSAANTAFLRRCMNTCPGNAPVQLSLATRLVQGGERGHCKGSQQRRDYAQVEQKGQATLDLHRPRAWREREEGQRHLGRQVGRVHMGSQVSKLLKWTLGRGLHPPLLRNRAQPLSPTYGQRVA